MVLVLVFLCGVANFAMHRAVLESGHSMISALGGASRILRPRVTLGIEFVLLLGALLLAVRGSEGWGWAYCGYSACNAMAAWLILSGRV